MGIQLYEHQLKALNHISNGCILCGGVGSGKSITALSYYYLEQGGSLSTVNGGNKHVRMSQPKDLYIITTARKRDTLEWQLELCPFLMSPDQTVNGYKNNVIIDSWNNIKKYKDITNAFFIFDEDRVVGSGEWVKAFIQISKNNDWILLSATPGDCWSDYIPVFIANGFYKNRTQFINEHVVYRRFTKFPQIDRYVGIERLVRLRKRLLVTMDFQRHTVSHSEHLYADYDRIMYNTLARDRWNIWDQKPIKTAGELCYALRRLVSTDISRQLLVMELVEKHPRTIIFYNFNYELELLKALYYGPDTTVAEWNGHKHQEIPKGNNWVYLVQYTAGAEGWNCIKTDTVIFFSQNYSYKVLEQARGRIDRINTPYKDLYYYHILSRSSIDISIARALKNKKKFNETGFANAKFKKK